MLFNIIRDESSNKSHFVYSLSNAKGFTHNANKLLASSFYISQVHVYHCNSFLMPYSLDEMRAGNQGIIFSKACS